MYRALATELEKEIYNNLSDQDTADILNDGVLRYPKPLETITISRYLLLNDQWLAIKNSTSSTSLYFKELISSLDTIEEDTIKTLENLLTKLVEELPSFTSKYKQEILNLGTILISKAESLSFPYLREEDIGYSRSLVGV